MSITISTRRRQALLVFAMTTAAIPATAQERPPEPPAEAQRTPSTNASRPVRFAIQGLSSGLQVRVVPKPEGAPESASTASCAEDCVLKLLKGSYTLIASRGDDHRTKEVELTSSQVLILGRSDGISRTFGTVIGITGLVVGALGAFVAGAVLAAPADPPGSDEAPPGRGGVFAMGILGLAAGTGLAVVGFSFAAANRAPSMDLEQMAKARPPASGAVGGISLSGKF
jgi:hypothetical protein